MSGQPPFHRPDSTSTSAPRVSISNPPVTATTTSAPPPQHQIYGLDDDSPSTADAHATITLISRTHAHHTVQRRALMLSELCKTMLEGDTTATEIELPLIDSDIVALCVTYLTYHTDIPARRIAKPIHSIHMHDMVDQFDADFVDRLNQAQLFKLMLAANYMNIKPLLALCSAKVATMLKGSTPQQIMHAFNIRGDYTQAEEEEIRRQYKELIG